MTKILIEKLDEVYIRIISEPSIEMELVQFFSYEYPGAKFTPQFRARLWDGIIKLFCPIRKTLYIGLLEYVKDFAERNQYEIQYVNPEDFVQNNILYSDIEGWVETLNPQSRNEPITVRDYQCDAIHKAINSERVLLLSPTASGKSLIIYSILRWHLAHKRKCIIIVPTTSLVEQLYTDFEDYSSANGWNVSKHCAKIYSGFEKDPKHITLTLEDGSKIYLRGSQIIKTLNRGTIEASNIKEGDDIDENYLRDLQTL